ncbi:MAG: histidine kinase [Eubacteriales bacterium]|nr:histidine kinase [Eubacteriales bacterium]
MNKKRQVFLNFNSKLIIGIIIIVVLNTLFAGYVYYNYAYKNTISNFNKSSENLLMQVDSYYTEHISGITTKVNALNNNMMFMNTVKEFFSKKDTVAYGREMSIVADYLSQLELSDSMIDSVYLYTAFGDFDNFVKIRNKEFDFRNSQLYRHFSGITSPEVGYFPETRNYVFQTEYPVIPIVYKKSIGSNRVFYSVALNANYIKNYLASSYSTFDHVYILQGADNVVNVESDKDKAVVELCSGKTDGNYEVTYGSKKYVVCLHTMELTGWKIYGVKSAENLVNNLNELKFIVTAQMLVVISLVIISGLFFGNWLTAPLVNLAAVMKESEKNHFRKKFEYDSKDEIGQLANSFNNMLDEINALVSELNSNIDELKIEKENVKKEQEEKRRAELKALQMQMNPHFLYNTLNTISWQAADQGAMEVCELAGLLGKFFRTSLNRGREHVTIGEEETQVESYLRIQKIRYKTKLDFEINIPEKIKKYYTVNLVLQPLVENAIYHGIKEVDRQGIIKISAQIQEEKTIVFIVEDNGYGIEPEKLAVLNDKLLQGEVDSSTGYGIYNVNERVRLSYGEGYGLSLESEQNVYTKAVLKIPAVRTLEEETELRRNVYD